MRKPQVLSRCALAACAMLAALCCAGCTEENVRFDPDPEATCTEGQRVTQVETSYEVPSTVDLLFVVSDAPGAQYVQRGAAAAMPSLIASMRRLNLDYRVGVTTGDALAASGFGTIRTGIASGCQDVPTIVTPAHGEDGGRFAACNVLVGTGGTHQQRLFDAGLDASTSGFAREGARLILVFVSDRDDCSGELLFEADDDAAAVAFRCAQKASSLRPVVAASGSGFAAQIKGLKSGRDSVSVMVIAGLASVMEGGSESVGAACTASGGGEVFPAPRLVALAEALAARSGRTSACADSYLPGVDQVVVLAEPSPVAFCTEEPVGSEEVDVQLVTAGRREVLSAQSGDYRLDTGDNLCPHGALLVSSEVMSADVDAVELAYCSP